MNRRIPFWRRFFVRPFEDSDGWMLSIAFGFLWINLRYRLPSMNNVYGSIMLDTGCYIGFIPWNVKEGDVIPGFDLYKLPVRLEAMIERL